MKRLPNVISIFRIILSPILLFLEPFSFVFWMVYFSCGFSDIMDGYIARKTNSTSQLGTILDSIADVVFLCVAAVVFLPILSIPTGVWIWIVLISLIRCASLLIVYCKFHVFAILHTYTNKATGLLLFLFPFLYHFMDIVFLEYTICFIASISAIEELMIHITSRELQRNSKGAFSWRKKI